MSAYAIARTFGCYDQTARNVIKRFDEGGLEEALARRSRRPRTIHAAFSAERAGRSCELLHRSPREFGKPTSLWTLNLAAEVSFEKGITERRVTGETVRARLGVRWLRARRWIRSPDPEYARKKASRPADPFGAEELALGGGFRG